MDILFLLVPLSVLLALAVMGVLAWAVWSGQFEELGSEAQRILMKAPFETTEASEASLFHINTAQTFPLQTSAITSGKQDS
jgi:cbb3-type cytochrome oxidase maturation protein